MRDVSPWRMALARLFRAAGSVAQAMLVLVAIAAALMTSATPAAAHGGAGGGSSASNFQTTIVDPAAPGLSWRTTRADGKVELTNNTDGPVTVLGYQGEPYLKFEPAVGVLRNTRSPATYLNEDARGQVNLPAEASPELAPDWQVVATGSQFAWHDQRAHWMAPTPPPDVVAAPDQRHLVFNYEIPLLVGTGAEPTVARGELYWFPSVAWWPPVLATAAMSTAVVAIVGARSRPSDGRWEVLARVPTVMVLSIVAANVVRAVDDLIVQDQRWSVGAVYGGLLVGVLVVVGVLCRRAWTGRPGGFAALLGATLLVALVFGGEAYSELSDPHLVSVLPMWVRRWTVAASYAVVAPSSVAAYWAGRWYAAVGRIAPASNYSHS